VGAWITGYLPDVPSCTGMRPSVFNLEDYLRAIFFSSQKFWLPIMVLQN